MRRIPTSALALAVALVSLTDTAWSQIVRTYPDGAVRVRAPFVRVYVGPNGETSVRAPFVAIDTPGREHIRHRPKLTTDLPGGPSLGRYSRPRPADPASLDWRALRRMLRSGAIRLEEELDRIPTGEGWKGYLRTTMLYEMAADESNRPPDPEAVEALRDALRRYEATSATRQSRQIASLAGFGTVHAALRELVIPPLHRLRRQLAESARDLERALMRLDTGSEWVRYLQLPDEIFFGESSADPRPPLPPSTDRTRQQGSLRLIEALARFDTVSHDPDFRAIRELPAFKTTHDRLAMYVALLSETPSDPRVDDHQIEVIPAPQPEPY